MRPALALVTTAALLVLGPGGLDADEASPGYTVRVLVTVAGDSGEAAQGEIEGRLVARTPSDPAVPPISVDLAAARAQDLELPSAGTWKLDVEAAGYWSAGAIAWPGREELVLRLFRTGTVTGRVTVPPGAELPAALDLRFAPVGQLRALGAEPSARQGSTSCPVDPEGRWRCEIPAGPMDVHLHATGFASVLRFDVPVEARGRADLGVVPLRPGASILGSVDLASVQGVESPVRVELTAFGRGDVSGPQHPRIQALARTTDLDARGFFQLHDLGPGVYRLQISAEGLAPAILERIEVQEGRESRILHPLVLPPLASFEIRVQPPLPPEGQRWQAHLLQPEISTESITGTLDGTGTWRREDLRPGLYLVRLTTRIGTIWHQQQYEVAGDAVPLHVDLPLVPIEGRLTIGGEPMRARIVFENPAGGEAVRLLSELDGYFSGYLPRPGEWRFAHLWRNKERHSQPPIRVERRGDGEPTWLDVDVPDTLLEGRVVDALGRPVRMATISLWRSGAESSEGSSNARSDDDGRFTFRGLQEGEYAVDALAGRFGSAREQVEIRDGAEVELELRLLGETTVEGRVLDSHGRPVAAAEVYAFPRLASPRRIGLVQRATGPAGRFELSIPLDTLEIDLLVLPPGFAARLLRVPFDPQTAERSLDLTVDTIGGTLHLQTGGSPEEGRDATLHSGDASMFFPPLRRWARLHGSPPSPEDGWWLPHFAPGTYRLCNPGGTPCAQGELLPGGVLVLETPPAAGEDEAQPNPEAATGPVDAGWRGGPGERTWH